MAARGGGFKSLSELRGGGIAELLLLRGAFGLVVGGRAQTQVGPRTL